MSTAVLPSTHRISLSLAAVTVLLLGCASTPGAEPNDMSAAEHREHAAVHEANAEHSKSMYDPNAAPEPDYRKSTKYWDTQVYNPTELYLADARKHRKHAEDHREAAEALETFEEAECKSFPAETRKACPFMGTLESVTDVDGGVQLTLVPSINVDASLEHARCHLAFAAKQGRKGMDECPLYLSGVSVEKAGERAIVLKAEEAMVAELRKRAQEHVTP